MILRFRAIDKDIFEAIRSGKKKVETRANTSRYKNIKAGNVIKFVCGDESFEKGAEKVEVFENIDKLLEKYKPEDINPKITTKEALKTMYYNFPGYRGKIEQFGIIAFELK